MSTTAHMPIAKALSQLGIDNSSNASSLAHLPQLEICYQLLCTRLMDDLKNSQDADKTRERLTLALELAERLYDVYHDCLSTKEESCQYYNDIKTIKEMIGSSSKNGAPAKLQKKRLSVSSSIRSATPKLNFPRLLIVRLKRVLDMASIISHSSQYRALMQFIGSWVNTPISMLAWLFYVPRSADNLLMMGKHLIPGFWMSQAEKDLGFKLRLNAQIRRRWFELGNDLAWLAVGFINCFILTGVVLGPFAIYLSVALFAFDVILATIRAYVELKRLSQVKMALMSINDKTLDISLYQKDLLKKMRYEQMRMALSISTCALIFLGMCLTIPFIAINPVIPLIGASLIVSVTLASFMIQKYVLPRYQPDKKLTFHALPKVEGTETQRFHPSLAYKSLHRSKTTGDLRQLQRDISYEQIPPDSGPNNTTVKQALS